MNAPIRLRAVVFDWGGVLQRTESYAPRERLASARGLTRLELEDLVFGGDSWMQAQLGRISEQEHWQQMMAVLGLQSADELCAFRDEFFAGDALDTALLAWIRGARRRVKTALLSNAAARLREVIARRPEVRDCFDLAVISAEVGLVKPDPAIYRLLLERLGTAAHETAFVDDSVANVQAAAALGLHAIHFTGRIDTIARLNTLLGEEIEPCRQAHE